MKLPPSVRARFAALGFALPQVRELLRLFSGDEEAEAAAARLVLLGADRDAVRRALEEVGRGELNCLVSAAFAQRAEREYEVLRTLVRLGASHNEQEVSSGFVRELTAHFGAREGLVFPRPEGNRRLAGVRVLPPNSPLVLTRTWAAESARSVWSIPVENLVVQFRFDARRPMLPREATFVDGCADACTAALQRSRRLAAILRMLDLEESERRRISRELHDDPGQMLMVARLQLELAEAPAGAECDELRGRLREIRETTEKTIVSVRKLMSDLSPAVLDQLGFSGAVRRLMTRFGEPEGGHARLHLGDLPPMDRRIETMLYRFLQECLANISRHSAAKNINVSLTASDTEVRLSVEDDGVGFDAADGTIRRNRFGLAGMRERVMLLGGKFSVIAVPASRVKLGISPGTRIVIKLPFIGIFQD